MDDLVIVSYNISFAEPSFVAPCRVLRAQEAPRLIREECLRSRPDIIVLQECPNESWGGVTFGPDYQSLGTQLASHVEGHIDLLVRRELAQHARRITLEHPALPLPAVAAVIALPNRTRVIACSVHFPHTKEGATARELMCEAIMQIISQQCRNFILIGDFNMREKEDRVVENLTGGRWIDVWKKATGEKKNLKFSWNSRMNLFHEPRPNDFQFLARFDRCYVKGDALVARQFDLIGNQPIGGRNGDYLSDHYGIAVKVGVHSSISLANDGANLGVERTNENKNTNGSNMNGTGMVDLTGDSDSDDADGRMSSTKKGSKHCNLGDNINNTINDSVVKSSDSKLSTEDLRRLRLQKFSGKSMTTMVQKSTMNAKTTTQPLTSVCSSSLLTRTSNVPRSSNKFTWQSEDNQSNQVAAITSSEDIKPMKPTKFTIDKAERCIIYMAIREKKKSNFTRGLAICNETCHEEIKDCLQMTGTRHVTMWQGDLNSDEVQNLKFNEKFTPIEIKLDGWQNGNVGCYLKLTEESEDDVQDLLAKIDGLPNGGLRPCDRLALYRKRQTYHPNLEKEFRKIRGATMSHNWGSVEGVSIRIKLSGGPYDQCRVLAESFQQCQNNVDSSQSTRNSGKGRMLSSKQPHPRNDQWNDGCDSDGNQNSKNDEEIRTEVRTFRDHSSSNTSIPLFIVSWNISETSFGQTSAAAPDPSLRAQESASLILEECFRLHFASQQQKDKTFLPDIIALQESPDELWGKAVFGPYGYVSVGTQNSHCGLVDLLIRKDFAPKRIALERGGTNGVSFEGNGLFRLDDLYQQELPSVAATVTLTNKTTVAVASNHLEPHASGASIREQQFKLLMEALTQQCANVILIGDMNMRQKEDRKTQNLVGGGWIDAWKEGSGSSKEVKMTWDSFSNRYHLNGFGFTARFDRAYVRGKELGVGEFGLIGTQPVNGKNGDHLSDHFGLIVKVNIAPSLKSDVQGAKIAAKRNRGAKEVDHKETAKSRKRNDDNATNSKGRIGAYSRLQQSTKNETEINISTFVQEQEQDEKSRYRHEELWDRRGSDSDDDIRLKETPCRSNGKQARLATAATVKSKTTESNKKSTAQFNAWGSKEDDNSKAKAKKKFKFESSSSEDDGEDLRRRLQEKLGRKYKKRKLQHVSNDTSSDED